MQVRALTAAGLIVIAVSATACSKAATPSGGSAPASSVSARASQAASAGVAATAAEGTTAAASGGGGGSVDVCSLMTSAQASSINSVTYGAATPKHVTNGYDTCTYKNTGKHASPVDIQDLTVTVVSLSDCYSQLEKADGPGVKVSGVGDDAFGYGIGIIVKVGDRCLDVSGLTDAELQDNYGPDTTMAKIIVAKLA
jgi:hypothetical protein